LASALATVLEHKRRRGAGTALYEAISAWARERGLEEVEAVVADNDPESLEFARRRGVVEDRREKGVALRLADIQAPAVGTPARARRVTSRQPAVAPAPRARAGHVRGGRRGAPGHPGLGGRADRAVRGLACPRHARLRRQA